MALCPFQSLFQVILASENATARSTLNTERMLNYAHLRQSRESAERSGEAQTTGANRASSLWGCLVPLSFLLFRWLRSRNFLRSFYDPGQGRNYYVSDMERLRFQGRTTTFSLSQPKKRCQYLNMCYTKYGR